MFRLSCPKTFSKFSLLLLAAFYLASCMSNQNNDIRIHGHRGCRGYLPENTIPGFVFAWENGTPVLELDVVLSADSELIVSHDPFMHYEICAFPDGTAIAADQESDLNIYRMSAAEVARFQCGIRPHPRFEEQIQVRTHKPLLTDLIGTIDSLSIQTGRKLPEWNIEIKSKPEWDNLFHPSPKDYANIFARQIAEINFRSDVYIQSFDSRILNALHQIAPRLKLVYLSEDAGKDVRTKLNELDFKPYGYSPNYSLVDQALVNYCSDHGLKLFVWTVNDKTELERLQNLGVKEIITDYPVKEKPALNEPALNY